MFAWILTLGKLGTWSRLWNVYARSRTPKSKQTLKFYNCLSTKAIIILIIWLYYIIVSQEMDTQFFYQGYTIFSYYVK